MLTGHGPHGNIDESCAAIVRTTAYASAMNSPAAALPLVHSGSSARSRCFAFTPDRSDQQPRTSRSSGLERNGRREIPQVAKWFDLIHRCCWRRRGEGERGLPTRARPNSGDVGSERA